MSLWWRPSHGRRVRPGALAFVFLGAFVPLGAAPLRAVPLGAMPSGPGAPQDSSAASDPAGVEAYVDARGPWLEALRDWLSAGGDASALGAEVAFSAPPKGDDEWIERDDTLLVIRSYGKAPEAMAADQVRRRLMRGNVLFGQSKVSSKVIEVRPTEGGGRVLSVWLEINGKPEFGLPPVWQLTATLEATFGAPSGNDVPCVGISLLSFERAQIDQPTFVEKTRSTLRGAPDAARVLGVGLDRWSSRLDDPALSAFFGHQGLAAGDVNGDGLDDLYVAMPAGVPNLLLVQDADGGVRDIAVEAGVAWLDDTKGVLIVDMDADCDLDIVSALGHVIVVQVNDGKGSFVMGGFGAAPDQASFYSISAADMTRDGVPEIFGTRYVTTRYADAIPIPFEEAQNGPSNHLFALKDGALEDVTKSWFPDGTGTQFSLSASFVEVNGDFSPDLYVVNDFGSNRLFTGAGAGKLNDSTVDSGLADAGAGMGAAWADYDGDGHLDVYVTNMYSSAGRRVAGQAEFAPGRGAGEVEAVRRLAGGNSLFRGDGEGRFERVEGFHAEMGRWGWGGIFTEFDGDGLPDLVVPAGFLTGPKPGDL